MSSVRLFIYSQTCAQRSPLGNSKVTIIWRVTARCRSTLQKIQSNLYKTALYIAVTLHTTVTGKLPQSFQLPYIFCKVDLLLAVPLYIMVTLPFPKGERCTQI